MMKRKREKHFPTKSVKIVTRFIIVYIILLEISFLCFLSSRKFR